ncbi:S53 family peptidase [Paralcaligenes ginsengisoli]
MAKFPLSGSERVELAGARCVGAADPVEQLEVTVLMRRRGDDELRRIADRLVAGESTPACLSREEFARKFSAASQDIARVTEFADRYGLRVLRKNAAGSNVVLAGTVAQFNAAFNVDLQGYEHILGSYRGRIGPLHIPEELKEIVTAVLGLDNRPQARSHFRLRPPFRIARQAARISYLPTQIASLYNFPDNAGKGQCIGLIELGGGYSPGDLSAYFSKLGLRPPVVTVVSVDGASHPPSGDPSGPDGEVMLDIEIAGAIAPEADIAVYFSTNSDAGFLSALNSAVHDAHNKPSIISISWGGPEPAWTPQSIRAFNDALQAAAAMGITVCAASGDNGASDGVSDGANHVDFPASSPYVLACGGTSLRAAGNAILNEVVWNDGEQGGAGGGGVSALFDLPVWQRTLTVKGRNGGSTALSGRGVPDVAGDADPMTGYQVLIDGTEEVVGGTSAVAPLWAALIARINASRGQAVGYVNAKLYRQPAAFNDITQGDNGGFAASSGWDACTGLGSPNGRKVADAL